MSATSPHRPSSSGLFIDAGRSPRGESRIGKFRVCPQLFAYGERLHFDLIPAIALTRGSMGHQAMAQQYAKWGAEQGGVSVGFASDVRTLAGSADAASLMDPEDAIREWTRRNGRGESEIDMMKTAFRHYLAKYPEAPGRILAVEYPLFAVLGEMGGVWGLWVVDPGDEPKLSQPVSSNPVLRSIHGEAIIPTPLNQPGHPEHGHPIWVSRRADAIYAPWHDIQRPVNCDHKFVAFVEKPGIKAQGYGLDNGFQLFHHMMAQVWPDYGGCIVQEIQRIKPFRVERMDIPVPGPCMDTLADDLLYYEQQIAYLDVHRPDMRRWPKANKESGPCRQRYKPGKCPGWDLCYGRESRSA